MEQQSSVQFLQEYGPEEQCDNAPLVSDNVDWQHLIPGTKLPLTNQFLTLQLLTQSKTGISAMELKRQMGVNDDVAQMTKHKLLQGGKEADNRLPISGIVQLDGVYCGGERRGGKRGRDIARCRPQPDRFQPLPATGGMMLATSMHSILEGERQMLFERLHHTPKDRMLLLARVNR